MDKKDKSSATWVVILFFILVVYCITSGILGMVKKTNSKGYQQLISGDYRELDAIYAKEIYEIRHLTNLIPSGKEHYYLVFGADGNSYTVVRASNKWFQDNFDENGLCNDIITVSGKVKRYSSKAKSGIYKANGKFEELNVFLDENYYVDLMYKQLCLLRLVLGVCLGGTMLLIFLAYKRKKALFSTKIDGIIGLAFMLASLVLIIYLGSFDSLF